MKKGVVAVKVVRYSASSSYVLATEGWNSICKQNRNRLKGQGHRKLKN